MKSKLILVRHAQAAGNMLREFHGWTDSSLTEMGHKQAQLAAESLAKVPIDVLYSSSLKRTLQTAQYIADVKKLPIIRTDGLKEINGGDWEGVNFEQLPKRWPSEYDSWENSPHLHKMPNGENMEDFQKRLIDEVEYIVSQNEGKNICIVTHGTAIKALICFFRTCTLEEMVNIPWHDNTSITIIEHEDGKYKLLLEGDAGHLGKEYSTIQNQDWWEDYIKKIEERKSK